MPWRGAVLLLLVACGSTEAPPPDAAPILADAGAPADAFVEPLPYGADVASLRLKRSIVVRHEPNPNAKAIGTVAQDTRVRFTRASRGDADCPRWIEIAPMGWVCERYLEPSKKQPVGVELPKLKEGELVPGLYGRVVKKEAKAYKSADDVKKGKASRTLAGSVTVRRMAEVKVGARSFWKTESGELVEASAISVHKPSEFTGVWIGADGLLPLAWTKKTRAGHVAVRDQAGAVVRKLPHRARVPVLELAGDKVRIGDGEWVARAEVHLATYAPPIAMTGPAERWFDVDLDEQIVIAYEGPRPVFATLTSSGNPKWPTAPGIYRVWIKFAETTMNGQMGDEQPYSVATVPWTMFFAKDLAFHTAYWHDRFGEARSHGCLNLSPRDARALYFWAEPLVPPGWSMVHGIVERPGSMVRVRTAAVPQPEFMGYARRVHEARLAALRAP